MPQIAYKKVSSSEVQGVDTFVTFRKLTVGEMRDLRSHKDEESVDTFEIGLETIVTHLESWNWTDDTGVPLPTPREDIKVLDILTDDEINFLTMALLGDKENRKK